MIEGEWTWDPAKNDSNHKKHGLRFELAVHALSDPLNMTGSDPCDHEERWRTFGQIQTVLIVIVHTDPVIENGLVVRKGRIISARKATSSERQEYENSLYGW